MKYFTLALCLLTATVTAEAETNTLLNASYDPTRELYEDLNHSFNENRKTQTKSEITIRQSHGGSGKQARAVIDGLEADVVTLALGYDIDEIAARGLLPQDWQKKFPHNSTPYSSTIVFLVRKGNPKQIHDWPDLLKDGVEIITPNPKTSGGARWNYLAAWGYALGANNNNEEKAKDFVAKLFKKVPVLDTGARGATTTFVERKIGDVLLAWENEAMLAASKLAATDVEIVVPSVSILAEPPVAVVEKYASAHGTTELAREYLNYLYSPQGQAIIATHYYRPSDEKTAAALTSPFPKVKLFTIEGLFGGWKAAQTKHFNDGGTFDQIYQQ